MDNKLVEAALQTVAAKKCPAHYSLDYRLDSDDVRAFNNIVESSKLYESKGVRLHSCEGNFKIRVYGRNPANTDRLVGVSHGVGLTSGALGGAASGTVFSPVVGTVIGAVVGAMVGGIIGGLVGRSLGGGGAGAGIVGAKPTVITAREVFKELPGFREEGNKVFCEIGNGDRSISWDRKGKRGGRSKKHEDPNRVFSLTSHERDFLALAEMSLKITNEEQHFVWEGYGLRVHIPQNSLPNDCSHCHLKIAVSLSGNFELPEDGVLVSAVYSFTHDLGDRELKNPVTIEMQHCASANVLSDLCVLRAAITAPYKFEVVPGGHFTDGYSAIKLYHFSLFTTFLKRIRSLFSPSPHPFEYCAAVYYTNILRSSFWVEIFIVRNLEAVLMCIKAQFKEWNSEFEPGPCSKVKFEDGAREIRLIIPESTISGWKMSQLNQLLVSKEDVDRYPSAAGHKLIPCQVKVEWVGGEDKVQYSQFRYEVEFSGAREKSYFLAVTLPKRCLCEDFGLPGIAGKNKPKESSREMQELFKLPSSPHSSFSPPSRGQSPSLQELLHLKVPQRVGTKYYKDFGTFLLNDNTGDVVSNIEAECQLNPERINRKILEKWIAGRGKPCTWATLIKTLRDCELNTLADDIKDIMSIDIDL